MRIAVAGGTGVVGRYVVGAARDAGHDVVVMARSEGVDIRTGEGLARALAGVEAVVDVTNPGASERNKAEEFFTSTAANLHRVGVEQGVRHLVVLSIVGVDRAATSYYAAKLAQERAALAGPVPATILRATQFHEFAAQMIARNREGSVARIPNLHVQPVAGRTVGRVLVELAAGQPSGHVLELAGPEPADLATLARLLAEHLHLGIEVQALEPSVPKGALLPGGGARLEGPTFQQWLASDDASSATLFHDGRDRR